MILAFAHPALVVPDLDRAIAFYSAMFGFEPMNEEGWSDNAEMDRAVPWDSRVRLPKVA